MGMDLIAIIDHNREADELLNLPTLISNSNELKKLFSKQHKCEIEDLEAKSKWKGPYKMTAENLELIWSNLKTETDFTPDQKVNYFPEIDTYFGEIYVYEKTITISPYPEHKYRNLRNPVSSEYVFKLNRIIAQIVGSKRIVYCCDSYYHPEILGSKSMEGENSESIIEYGNKIFGEPPKEINKAVENLYFIDDFDINLEALDPDKEVWSRAKFEYDKGQKGEAPYNI